ncbi:hypothetical protein MtrunA17_Chr1g0200141 [Medicago truncatula]|uniref:Uncharacterized protein n=1 Tax=Medicago truncatula TaxID=3880 RepID=A0A396JZT3_MEDTR|nr:hypothetical protein MtrunA17_Chr1g0200141 [Medicago truncatula]
MPKNYALYKTWNPVHSFTATTLHSHILILAARVLALLSSSSS